MKQPRSRHSLAKLWASTCHKIRLLWQKQTLVFHPHYLAERPAATDEFSHLESLLYEAEQTAKIGGWEYDIAKDQLFWTAGAYRIYETTPPECKPTMDRAFKLYLPGSKRLAQEAFANAIEKGEGCDLELETLTSKGRKIDLRTTCHVTSRDGHPVKLTGTFQDITERKKAEETLRQSKQLLEASQAIAKVGGWELDIDTGHLFWTAETYRLLDTSPEEFNPTVDAGVDLFLPESRREISEALERAMTRGEGYDLELETLTTKGRKLQVRTTCVVTLDQGHPVKLTGIFQDITDRKEKEMILREKERFLSSSARVGKIGGWTLDVEKKFVSWTAETFRIHGWPQTHQPDITRALEYYHPDDRALISRTVRDIMKKGVAGDIDARLIPMNGKTRWVRERVSV